MGYVTAMGYLTADQVSRYPCGSTRHNKYDTARDPGPTVADLTEALGLPVQGVRDDGQTTVTGPGWLVLPDLG